MLRLAGRHRDVGGNWAYGYDAWNRMITLKNAYRMDDGVLHEGSVVSTSAYDGENLRVSKAVTTGTSLDGTATGTTATGT